MEQFIKNIEFSTPLAMETLVMYQEGQVVSRTLAQNKHMNMTLFAFDKNEEISSHASSGDAMVYILDGESEVTIGEDLFTVKAGETIVMPAGIPHALLAKERFKMMLIVVFKPADVVNF
ncbi:MAG TPA: cupin domain-containing protein [Fusibacter sp.]|nr:cupin domain-containing protein [Fusibacter sp.]